MSKSSYRSTRQIGLLLIAVFIILQQISQTAETVQLRQTEQELAEYAKREWLDPVIGNLRRRARGDQSLLNLLDEINIWTRKRSANDFRPDAYADVVMPENKPIIYINLPFLLKCFMLADLAGLTLTGRDEAGPILYKAAFDYGQAVSGAMENSLETPLFYFSEKDISDPVLRVMTRRLGQEAFLGGTAWVVLHEIAHHKLGHTKLTQPPNKLCIEGNLQACSESRKMELEADKWAFSMMKELGYGLAPLHAFLLAHEVGQEIRFMAQAEPTENYSTHPSFSTRRKEIEKLYDVSKPPQGDFLIILTISQDEQGRFQAIETVIPRNPETEGWLYAIQSGSILMPYEWTDGQIYIYGRSPERLTEMIVHQPGMLKPEITFREILMKDGSVSEAKTRGFQLDYAWSQHLKIGSLALYEILETSPRRLFLNALAQVESHPDVISTADRVYIKQLQEARKILINYAQGELTLADAQKQIKTINENSVARLKKILGDAKYAQLSDLLLSSPIVNIGLDRWINLKQK